MTYVHIRHGQGGQPAWYEVAVNKMNDSSKTSRQLMQKNCLSRTSIKIDPQCS